MSILPHLQVLDGEMLVNEDEEKSEDEEENDADGETDQEGDISGKLFCSFTVFFAFQWLCGSRIS